MTLAGKTSYLRGLGRRYRMGLSRDRLTSKTAYTEVEDIYK